MMVSQKFDYSSCFFMSKRERKKQLGKSVYWTNLSNFSQVLRHVASP